MVRTAAHAYHRYGLETAYGTAIAARPLVLGPNAKLSGIERKNNSAALSELGRTEVESFHYMRNEVGFSASWVLANPWVFELLMGKETTTNPSDPIPYQHKYEPDKAPKSATFEIGFDGETNPVIREIKGVLMSGLSLSSSLDSFVNCSSSFMSGAESAVGTTYPATGVPVATPDPDTPYTFVEGTLGIKESAGAGTVTNVGQLQSINASIQGNPSLLYEHGKADAVGAYRKMVTYSGSLTVAMVDKERLDLITNRASAGELDIKFARGTGASEESITFKFTGISFHTHSYSLEAVNPVFENLSWKAKSLEIVAINGEANGP